jgi:hypothetical protein
MKKPSKQTLRNKTDKLLQDYIRAKHGGTLCYACGERLVTVGHHFVSKKNSLALRYYLPNLIPLCKSCHYLVHNQPHLVEPKICYFMEKDWYEDLMTEKRKGAKFTLEWVQTNYNILSDLYTTLKGE